ncbi:hypothetical protein GGR50DRAFT_655338 [Xylaria sp. CBS 124048]|nr:hypothetical protein GGR50DRAFT_655338 [Xylaria sp. CBS 124048]
MPNLGRWFSRAFSRPRSSNTPDPTSTSKPSIIHRVLEGRLTKSAPPKAASSAKPTKCKDFVGDNNDKAQDEDDRVAVTIQQERGSKDKRVQGDDGNEDDKATPAADLAVVTMGFSTGPKTLPGQALAEQQNDSESSTRPITPPNQYSAAGQNGSDGAPDAPEVDSELDSDSDLDMDHTWRLEQIYLNAILNARNEFTLMPSTWKMHFRGIPLPDSLFYIKTKEKSIRPRIYARTDRLEYRGALALRKLIEVHARIQDILGGEAAIQRDEETTREKKHELISSMSANMAKQLRRVLEQALDWAKKDGTIENYADQLPPNVKVMELKGIAVTDQPESEAKVQSEMHCLAEEWRIHAAKGNVDGNAPVQAPVIFGFIIMKHIITIVTLDASNPRAIIHVPCQLHMAERNQHQWNALAILVTICWARDVLLDYINDRPDLKPIEKAESSDPDA